MDYSALVSANAKLYNPIVRSNLQNDAFGKLKKMLVSRDAETQSKAVSFILNLIRQQDLESSRRKTIITNMVENEICTFLCEAMATFLIPLLRNILRCFEIFMYERTFYIESNTSYIISSVVRTIHYWIRENISTDAISYALIFLAKFFVRLKEYNLESFLSEKSSYNSEQTIKLLSSVIVNTAIGTNTKLAASKTMHALVNYLPPDLKINNGVYQISCTCLGCALTLLCSLLTEEQNKFSEGSDKSFLFGFICYLGTDALRFSDLQDIDFADDQISDKDQYVDTQINLRCIKGKVLDSISMLISHIKNFYNELSCNNFTLFMKFLHLFIQSKSYIKNLPSFSINLAQSGFLTILPKLKLNSGEPQLRLLSDLNLASMLTIMSCSILNVDLWPGGKTVFSKHIQEGLLKIEHEPSLWPKLINNLVSERPMADAMMVYLYFYCLTSPNPQNLTSILVPFLVNYILKLPGSYKPPQPIFKCICLIFAMSNLSDVRGLTLEERLMGEKAIRKFFYVLRPDLEQCYTHHPAMLLWIFSSASIPTRVRAVFVSKWLENDVALPDGVTVIADLWWTLIDVIRQSTNSKVLHLAAKILEDCLKTECNFKSEQQIASELWEMLPHEMTQFHIGSNEGSTTSDKIEDILKLTTSLVPDNLPLTTVQQTACLLTAIHPKLYETHRFADTKLPYYSIKQGFYLLQLAVEKNDVSVPSIMINKRHYILSLLSAVENKDEDISCMALQFLAYLCFYQNKYSLKVSSTFTLEPNVLIAFLCKEHNQNKMRPFLQLVYMILCSANHTRVPLMMIRCKQSEPLTVDAFKLLYYRLQMVCCHKSPEQSSSGWKCLGPMLEYAVDSQKDSKLVSLLTLQPWNHMLVRFHLQQNNATTIGVQFLKFLSIWLRCWKVIMKGKRIVLVRDKDRELVCLQEVNVLYDTLTKIVRAFDNNDLLNNATFERREMIVGILSLISEFLIVES